MWLCFAQISKRQKDSASNLIMRKMYETAPLVQGKLSSEFQGGLTARKSRKKTVQLYTFSHLDHIICFSLSKKFFNTYKDTFDIVINSKPLKVSLDFTLGWGKTLSISVKTQAAELAGRYKNTGSHKKVQHRQTTFLSLVAFVVQQISKVCVYLEKC